MGKKKKKGALNKSYFKFVNEKAYVLELPLGRLYIRERWGGRMTVPKLTSDKDGVKTLVNSCIDMMHSLQMSLCRKSCAAWLRDRGRHAVSRSR